MIFNFWRPASFFRPKKDGWYQCWIKYDDDSDHDYVMDLYFDSCEKKWIDRRRKSVFNGYKVYKSGREPLDYNRVYEDNLCERVNVFAWKKMPMIFRFRKRG